MVRFLALLVVLTTVFPAAAQQRQRPTLVIESDGKPESLGLERLAIEVRIYGYVAETSTTMTFANPLSRAAEGDLVFPLPQGATVSGYALDVQGKMVDGVAVGKQRARQVFEAEMRKRVDPGLVEWTAETCFRTRVFPIPAQGRRVVRVQYVSELVDEAGCLAYHLPLDYERPIPAFSLRVEVVKSPARPTVRQAAVEKLDFEKQRDSFVAETKLENALLRKELVVSVPEADRRSAVVEKAEDGQVFFAIRDCPAKPKSEPPPPAPRHIVVYWDASGSRGQGDRARELGLLKALLAAWAKPVAERSTAMKVDLVLLRNEPSAPRRFLVGERDAWEVTQALERVFYDGGTQLGALAPLPGEAPDLGLLFSDGISTFGRADPGPLKTPLYVFSSDAGANRAFLRRMAFADGGRYFDLASATDAEVLAAVKQPAPWLVTTTVTDGKVMGMLPATPWPTAGHVSLVGQLGGLQATVTLRYGPPGQAAHERTFRLDADQAVDGSLLRRLWAQRKLAELMAVPRCNEAEIVALGKEYGLVTPFTSLLVLESLEQYVQYEIAPPTSQPEMLAQYERRVGDVERQQRKQRAEKIAQVLRLWEERVTWWKTDFKPHEGPDRRSAPAAKSPSRPAPVAPRCVPRQPVGPNFTGRRFSGGFGGLGGMSMGGSGFGGLGGMGGGMGGMGGPGSSGGRAASRPSRSTLPGPSVTGSTPPASAAPRGETLGTAVTSRGPETPYLKRLREAPRRETFAVYMRHRPKYADSPAFFLDCAELFFERGDPDLGVQVLSNIAEMEVEDAAALRVLGHRLAQAERLDLAVLVFEDVLRIRPGEPQSYRDLALVLADRADAAARPAHREAPNRHKPSPSQSTPAAPTADAERLTAGIQADYRRAAQLLTEVVVRPWDGQFAQIELPALMELNRILVRAKPYDVEEPRLDRRFAKLLDVDLRVVMTWHADKMGLDLRVTEPSDETASSDRNRTAIGGLRSSTIPEGCGPEEYLLRKAAPGKYTIQTTHTGSPPGWVLGPVTVQVDVFTNFGRANENRKSFTMRLKSSDDTVTIGKIEF
jgi:Ca-activated chloride channel family protein